MGGALGVGGLRDDEQETRIPTGYLELSARRGVAPGLDLGLKLYTVGLEASATWRLARGRWSWALAPYAGGARTHESGATTDALHLFVGSAVIASRPLGARWTLGVGPLVGWGLYWPTTGGTAQGGWLGGFVHGDAAWGSGWHVTPELGLYRVVAGEVPVRGGAAWLGASLRREL